MASVNATSTRPTAGTSELREGNKEGQKIIQDERFDYIVSKDSFKIVDRKTGENIHVWGDPHVTTGDGDKGQFQRDNLTFELPNGSKVTIEPTEFANGVAFIKNIAIMKGGKGVEITGVNTNPVIGNIERSAAELDAKYRDGTVLFAKSNVEDLYLPDGSAWVGGDANAAFGERVFDGLGGEGRINVEALNIGLPTQGLFDKGVWVDVPSGDTKDVVGPDGKTEKVPDGTVTRIDVLNDPWGALEAVAKLTAKNPNLGAAWNTRINTTITALTNIFKSFDESQQAIARNLA